MFTTNVSQGRKSGSQGIRLFKENEKMDILDYGKDAINSVVEKGEYAIKSAVDTGKDEIKDAASRALQTAINAATDAAFDIIKPAIKKMIKIPHLANYNFDLTIGPFTLEMDKLKNRTGTLIQLLEKPPKRRKEYKHYFKELSPTSFKVELSVQAAAVLVSSKSVGVGFGITIEPDYQNLDDQLDPIFEALNIK